MCVRIEEATYTKRCFRESRGYYIQRTHIVAIVGRATCWAILMGSRRVVVNGNGEKCMNSVKNVHKDTKENL